MPLGTLSWVNRFRRLKVRYQRQADIHQAFLDLGCALICWRYVQRLCWAHNLPSCFARSSFSLFGLVATTLTFSRKHSEIDAVPAVLAPNVREGRSCAPPRLPCGRSPSSRDRPKRSTPATYSPAWWSSVPADDTSRSRHSGPRRCCQGRSLDPRTPRRSSTSSTPS